MNSSSHTILSTTSSSTSSNKNSMCNMLNSYHVAMIEIMIGLCYRKYGCSRKAEKWYSYLKTENNYRCWL